MIEKIEKMRKRSRAERKRVTFFTSLVLTSIVALIWVTAVFPRTVLMQESEAAQAQVITPLSTLKKDAGVIWGDLKRGASEVQKEARDLFDNGKNAVETEETGATSTEALEMGSRGTIEAEVTAGEDEVVGGDFEAEAPEEGEADSELEEVLENNAEASGDSFPQTQ